MFRRFSFKNFNELRTDDLALFLGIVDAGKTLNKLIGRINDHQIQCLFVFSSKRCTHFLPFIFSQQTIVDKYAHELFTDRSRKQGRDDA